MTKPFLRAVDGGVVEPPGEPPSNCPIADQIRALAEYAIERGAVTFCAVWEAPGECGVDSAPQADGVEAGAAIILRSRLQEKFGGTLI
jgi:hypothetical protein